MSLTKIADADKHLHGHHHDGTPQHADHSRDTKQGGLHDHHKKHQETKIGVDIDYLCGFIHIHTYIRAYAHTYIHTYIRTLILTYMYAHTIP